MADLWNDGEDRYWRENYSSRPYASGGTYETFRAGYRYGYESARLHRGRPWGDVERDLEREWNSYPHRGRSTWQQVKNAVRDAWDRVTGPS